METIQPSAPATLTAGPPSRLARVSHVTESLIIAALIAASGLVCLHRASVSDPDIWWHLRTGQWILTHHALPHTDHYTSFAADKPWQPYSWLYELIVYLCFQRFGISGILVYTTALVLSITAALYHLVRRLQPDFSTGVLLTLVASLSLMRLFTPRPWLFTILFFVLQLDVLFYVRKTGTRRELLWLPLIYVLWANIHIQFIDGLIVLGIALGETLLSLRWPSLRTRLRPADISIAFAACVLATLVCPFGWHIYQIAYAMATQPGIQHIEEIAALPFRSPTDYCLLFLALAAAAALGYARRLQLFEILLLAFAAVTSFRSERDMWIMLTVAAAILAQGIPAIEPLRHRMSAWYLPLTGAAVALVLFIGVRAMHMNNTRLNGVLASNMPVRAIAAIKQAGYRGPLYNTFGWGGYLIWDLRMPVSIDGRTDVDGDQRMERSYLTWNAQPGWQSDPDLGSAGLVVGPVTAPLTQLLRLDSRFQLAYQDDIAAVFIARRLHETPAISPSPTR